MTDNESARRTLLLQIYRARRAWRAERIARGALIGAATGLFLSILLMTLARLFPIFPPAYRAPLSLLLWATATLIAALSAWGMPLPLSLVVREIDRRLSLHERLRTAWELPSLPADPQIANRCFEDALNHIRSVRFSSVFNRRIPSSWIVSAIPILTLLLLPLILLSAPTDVIWAEREAIVQRVAEQRKEIQELRDRIAEDPTLSPETRQEILATLEDLLDDLDTTSPDLEEVLARLGEAEEALRPLQGDQTVDLAQEALRRSVASLEGGEEGEVIDALHSALQNGDLNRAAEILQALTATEGEQLSYQETMALAEQMARLAQELQQVDPELARSLQTAAAHIRSGDIEAARQALGQSAQRLHELASRAADQQAAESVRAQLQEAQQAVAQAVSESRATARQSFGSGQQTQGTSSNGSQQGRQQGASPSGSQGGTGSGAGHGDDSGLDSSLAGRPSSATEPSTNAPADPRTKPYEPLFAPQYLEDAEVELLYLSREGEIIAGGESPQLPHQGVPLVPYDRIYAAYREQAVTVLEESYIPLGVKTYIRDYFSSLAPEEAP